MAVQGDHTEAACEHLDRHARARDDEMIRNDVMPPTRKFRSDAFEAIHSSASALLKVDAIDKAKMREFDATCLNTPADAPLVGKSDGA